jgi:multimeric flavodoxin WrbA
VRGLLQCLQKGKEKCPHKDDRDIIVKKMLDADGVVFSSPVYVMNVTGIFKNFVDRLAFICHRPAFFRQHALCVANTGAIGTGRVTKYMAEIAIVWGFRSAVRVGVRTNPMSVNEISPKAEKKLRKAANRFDRNIVQCPEPTLSSVIQFRVQRAVFNDPEIAVDLVADHEYYKELAGRKYYMDADVSWWKNAIGWLVERIARSLK